MLLIFCIAINVSVDGIRGSILRDKLSEYEICISVKSACSADGSPSRAVMAVSKSRKNALSSWRISLSHLTQKKEIIEFICILKQCIGELKNK